MNSSQANFYKPNSSKIKLTNVYPYDSFRPGGINEFTSRGKSSLSPNKMLSQKEFFNKTRRNNSHQNNFNSYNVPYKYNDIDKLVEEVTNFKLEMKKKNKELHSLKIAFAKLDEENKKNLHVIEEVIIEANKHRRNNGDGFKFDPNDLENEIRNCLTYSVTSDKLLAKLLESHAINNLKRQIFEYKNKLATKDDELANFKVNTRITKFQELDGKLKNTIDELIHLKENYSLLMNLFNEKESRLRENLEEKETYKCQSQKLKFQNEELKERVSSYQEANLKMNEQIKFLEEKNSNFKYQISTFKTQLKEKEFEIAKLKSDLILVENYKAEREKYEKTLKNLNSNLTNLKEDLERKSNKLRELQRMNSDLKQRCENVEANKNNEPISRNKENKSKCISGRKDFEESMDINKDKKIKNLEEENVKLRKEIIKLNDDLINKADNQLANIEKEFNSKNTNDNLQCEINNIIQENKKEDLSNFDKNLEKELLTQDDLESENKFSDILNPLKMMDNKDKTSHRSFSSKNRLQDQISINRKNNNIQKNHDNQRYYQEPEENYAENNLNNQLDELENRNYENKTNNVESKMNEDILKNSLNNSLNKEENNFNYSDFKNKNDFEDEYSNLHKELRKDEKLNRIRRPEPKKKKDSAGNKEKLNQMLIDEENRNLNSSSENNLKNKLNNNEFDACDEYLREHEDFDKSGQQDLNYEFDLKNQNAQTLGENNNDNYNEESKSQIEDNKTANHDNQKDLLEENYDEFEKSGEQVEEFDKNNENDENKYEWDF